jgi:hypothetical protein
VCYRHPQPEGVQPQPPPEDPKLVDDPPVFAEKTDNCICAFLLPHDGHSTDSWVRRTSFSNGSLQSLQMYS